MNKILTIVVPSYNAEKFLRDNLDSVCIKSLLQDIEVLVINDGSTDGTRELAEEYAERYPDTVRVITKENGGHGSGINCGIRHASGMYFKVIDADDWVDRDAFIRLVSVLKEQKADVVSTGFLWAYEKPECEKENFSVRAETEVPFAGVEYGKEYRFDEIADQLYVKMHNMTIRTAIMKDHAIHIDENCFYVDTEYITYPIPYVETICFIDAFVYYYRIGRQGQSVSMEKMQRNEANYNRVLESLFAFYHKLGQEIPCSEKKKRYIAGIIARVAAGKIKIMMSFPVSGKKRRELMEFDRRMKAEQPDIYRSNINRAVSALRKTGYWLYYPAAVLVRKKYR